MTRDRWLFLGMVLVSSCATCPRAKVNTSDSTPPTLVWNVTNLATNVGADHPATTTINAKRGESYRVIPKAHDPDGIQSITVGPASQWTCTSGDVGQNKIADFVSSEQKVTPDANGEVLQDIFLIMTVDLAMPCQDASWHFSGGNYSMSGQAKNWGNQVTSGTLSFHVTP